MSVVSAQSKRSRPGSSLEIPSPSDISSSSSRQRQSKKDEAIRKKIEQELSKKRGSTSRIRQTRKVAGTVSALRPAQALTVRDHMLVMEAAQLMAAKRSDCVLVVDDEEHLSGIFTAKDLAYRVVASHMDARATTVNDIMTRNPMCVTADTSAQDALNLMVSRGFRHLPVCNEEGDIFGLLDITKCLYEALNKMERAYGSSRKLYDALEGVEREWNTNSPSQLVQYMEALREKMSCPDLTTVLDHSAPVQVPVKANVRDVARLMKEHHTTAVLVMDHGGLAGIFTSKDIVLRVIAAGLAPETCSVVRVMTPHPDTALPTTSILDGLKKMHDGHYLNLPVIDDDKQIVGLVDVLRLTYATLDQINSIEGNGNDGGKFWSSMLAGDHTETDSAISDSLSQAANSHMFQPPISPQADRTMSPHSHAGIGGSSQHPAYSEVMPGDSTSVANADENRSTVSSHAAAGTFAFKFNYGTKAHRFRCEYSSYAVVRDHVRQKIMAEHLSLSQSYVKVETEEQEHDDDNWLNIAYLDDEDDEVLMTCDSDLQDAVELARKQGHDRVRLFVHDAVTEQQQQKAAEEAAAAAAAAAAQVSQPSVDESMTTTQSGTMDAPPGQPTISAMQQVENEDDENDKQHQRSIRRRQRHRHDSEDSSDIDSATSDEEDEDQVERQQRRRHRRRGGKRDAAADLNLPIPQEMLLPAAITFLGVVILGVFTITKLTGSSSDRRF
ncbi:CBS-domain-containing protein [Lichtheimia hyalospora FSU 10163]|nr:CBS-domain-containing protein [Lichtheimia hyalospora FSU 10163]